MINLPKTLEKIERAYIKTALTRTDGNKMHAAKLLGITRFSLLRRLRRLEEAHGKKVRAKNR